MAIGNRDRVKWLEMEGLHSGIQLSKGDVEGHEVVRKIGENTAVGLTALPLWDGLTALGVSSTADIDYVVSSSASDTTPAAVTIEGLDTNWEWCIQTPILTGQTPVELTTPLIRVNKMYSSGGQALVGDVYCYVSGNTVTAGVPQTAADIRAKILIGNEQTTSAIHTVPADTVAFITGVTGVATHATASTSISTISTWIREFGDTPKVIDKYRVKNSETEKTRNFHIPIMVPEKTDIIIKGLAQDTSTTINATLELVEVKTDQFNS